MSDFPEKIYIDSVNNDGIGTAFHPKPHSKICETTEYIRADLVSDTNAARAAGRCLILDDRCNQLSEALLTALPYVEDVLSDPEQLKCFKAGAVQKDMKKIKTALEKAGAI